MSSPAGSESQDSLHGVPDQYVSGSKSETLWYFAYGSNMSRTKFTTGRGIIPIARSNVRIPGWRLSFEVPGVPYTEPGMGAITPITPDEKSSTMAVHGVAYMVTPKQYISIIRSEGGGIAYESVELEAEVLETDNTATATSNSRPKTLRVNTFLPTLTPPLPMSRLPPTHPEPLPSARYLSLLTSGAAEADLPSEYQNHLSSWPIYHPPADPIPWIIRAFLSVAIALMGFAEKLCYAHIDEETGTTKVWVRWVVRAIVRGFWAVHDGGVWVGVLEAGDGRDQGKRDVERDEKGRVLVDEKTRLMDLEAGMGCGHENAASRRGAEEKSAFVFWG